MKVSKTRLVMCFLLEQISNAPVQYLKVKTLKKSLESLKRL